MTEHTASPPINHRYFVVVLATLLSVGPVAGQRQFSISIEIEDQAPKAVSTLYTVEVLSFKPAMFPDPNRWGCVVIVKNPHASSLSFGAVNHPLAGYGPGEHCGKALTGQGNTLTPWDYIVGWAKAYEIVPQFYDEAKVWTATQFANMLPCDMLGKAASDCKQYGEQLAGAAINVGLASAGVPPSLPELNAAAEGQAVEVGVGFHLLVHRGKRWEMHAASSRRSRESLRRRAGQARKGARSDDKGTWLRERDDREPARSQTAALFRRLRGGRVPAH